MTFSAEIKNPAENQTGLKETEEIGIKTVTQLSHKEKSSPEKKWKNKKNIREVEEQAKNDLLNSILKRNLK